MNPFTIAILEMLGAFGAAVLLALVFGFIRSRRK